jgi:hypothetical protein
MSFHVTLQPVRLVLQLSARAPERVVDGEMHVGVTLVSLRRARDFYTAAPWQGEADVDLVEPARAMVFTWPLENHATCGQATEPVFQARDVFGDFGAQRLGWPHSLKLDLGGVLHDALHSSFH